MEEFKKPAFPIPVAKENPTIEEINVQSTAYSETNEVVKSPTKSNQQTCPYKVPSWSNVPDDEHIYSFEVLKSGQIIDRVKNLQSKDYWTFGRLPENDIEMAHPTISRFHAVLQYRPKKPDTETSTEEDDKTQNETKMGHPDGWYVYDLDSTHGTFLNKQRIPPKVYIRIRVGYILKLGASTRSYILQGPSEDEEPVSELTVTELKAKRQRDLEEAALEKKRLVEEAAERERNEGCSWGMGDDADEETDLTHNPFASTNNEELFLDDPKKTLRGYFEREGLQLEYKCDEMSAGSFVCRVELPLDDDNGRPIIAEVVHKGKKKDCVVQCALEACRILDRHGVLRQANQEPLKRKQKSKESDSDDDEFWDRTGDVERKKQRRANVSASVTLTYDDLLKQESDLNKELEKVLSNITAYQEQQKLMKSQKDRDEQGDDLDSYMENLQQAKENPVDKTEIKKLRLEEMRIKTELQRNQRLLKIAKPVDLSFTRNPLDGNRDQKDKTEAKKKQLPMIGKRNQFSKFKLVKPSDTAATAVSNKPAKPQTSLASDEEEIEEEGNNAKGQSKSEGKLKIHEVFETHEENEDNQKNLVDTLEKEATDMDSTPLSNIAEVHEKITKKPVTESKEQEMHMEDECIKSPNTDDISKTNMDNTSDVSKTTPASSESSKKRRQRNRQRGKREVDMDDDAEYESTEKYAKWVPPENQTGDGFTELNAKYGY